jgi:drug/metabolite transporter (DMT)-like permease
MTIVVWGYNFIALKVLYREVAPGPAALVRHAIMWLCLCAIVWAMFRKDGFRPWRFDWRTSAFGAIAMGVYMVLFVEALNRTSAPEGAIVIATAPLFTTLFAVLAKQEPFSLRVLFGALVAFGGVALVVFGGAQFHADHLLGNGLMLASSITWALGTVISRPLVKERPAIVVLTESMPAAFLVLIPYALTATLQIDWRSLHPESWWALAHFTFLAGVAGFVGFFVGVRQIGAAGAMMYQYCVAPLATLFAWWLLKEALNAWQLVGMAVVLAGVVAATAARKRVPVAACPAVLECPAEA